jgi:hypothetical protein
LVLGGFGRLFSRFERMKQWMMAQQPELNSLDIRSKCATVPQ